MKTITHEGQEYILKTDMEEAIKDRITKLSTRAIQAEEQVKSLQDKLDSQSGELGKIETLNTQIQKLGEELEKSNSRYTRHTALADLGFQDADLRDLVEWQFEKAMSGKPKKDQVSMVEWLQEIKADPSKAPIALKPHLSPSPNPQPQSQEPTRVETVSKTQSQVQEPPVILPPKTNVGTQPPPVQSTDLLKRGTEDFEFYKQNREAIREAWRRK